ncbi:hypothetical protein D3C75_721280 [compost metagenome]
MTESLSATLFLGASIIIPSTAKSGSEVANEGVLPPKMFKAVTLTELNPSTTVPLT